MVEVIGSTPIFSTQTLLRERFLLMYFVYILYSARVDRYYVGQTEDLALRMVSHLSGISRYTSIANDWKMVYSEQFETRSDAIKRENEIKRKKSKKYIQKIIAESKED